MSLFRLGPLVVLAATMATPSNAQSDPLLIIGGKEVQTAPEDVASSPQWVVLGAAGSGRSLRAPTAQECALARVTFHVEGVRAPGAKEVTAADQPGQTVTGSQLATWGGGSELRARFRSVAMTEGFRRVYCVARASLTPAPSPYDQRVVAVVGRSTGEAGVAEAARATPRALAVVEAGDYTGGGTYLFTPFRHDTGTSRMVIVGRSDGSNYGYIDSQARGTFAVALGRWDPATDAVVPPTGRECADAQVQFRLLAPKEAGPVVPTAPVQAFVADGSYGKSLFGKTYSEPARTSHRALIQDVSPPGLCVAQAPVRLAGVVGYQQVAARVVRGTDVPDLSIEEVMGRQVNAEAPAVETYFNRTRVHAKPRAFVGALLIPGGFRQTSTDSTGAEVSDRTYAAPAAGFDLPLEPLTGWRGFGSARLVLATELSGEFGEQIYLGVSVQSLTGISSTASSADLSAGVSLRTRGGGLQLFGPSFGLLLDLQSSLKGIAGVFGLP